MTTINHHRQLASSRRISPTGRPAAAPPPLVVGDGATLGWLLILCGVGLLVAIVAEAVRTWTD